MRILNTNTLYDIARHSDKTLKLADFMVKANQPFLFHEMVKIDKNSNAIEAIEAYHKDIQKTVSHFEKVHQLLSTVDEKNNVIHLKNKEKNLVNIFGEAYDPEYKVIDFGTCKLDLSKVFDKESFTKEITENTVNMPYEKYIAMYKGRKTIFKLSDQLLNTNEERISFLSVVKEQEEYRIGIESIRNYGQEFSTYRSKMNLESKNKIDNEITFNRSMIDSVTKQSTYMTKEKGIEQLATSHKKDPILSKRLLETLKNSKVVTAIEIDQDASMEAIENVIKQMESIEFNLANEIVFKARKLGNYNANGLYLDSQKIVAVDIKNPSAAIHECIHAVDIGNEDLYYSQQRKDIISKFSQHIKTEELPEGKIDYYLNPKEIIARLGEVSYILNKYDYQLNESIVDFEMRVSKIENNENPYDLNLAKPIRTYTRDMANIYFNIDSIPSEDLIEAKNFYQSYFGVEGQEIRKINTIEVQHESARETQRAKVKRYEIDSVSLFTKDNIKFSLDYNKEHKLIEMDVLLNEIIQNPTKLARKVKLYNNDTFKTQRAVFKEIGAWLSEQNDPYLIYKTIESIAQVYPLIDTYEAVLQKAVVNNDIKLPISNFKEKYEEELERESIELKKIEEKIKSSENYDSSLNLKRYEQNKLVSRLRNMHITDYNGYINEKFPEYQDILNKTREAFAVEKRKDGTIKSSLNSTAQRNIYRDLIVVINKKIEELGFKEVFIYSNKNDLSPYLLIQDGAFKRTFFDNNYFSVLEENKNDIMGIFLANNIAVDAVLNKESFIEKPVRSYDDKGNVVYEGKEISPLNILSILPESTLNDIKYTNIQPSQLMRVFPDYSADYISENITAKLKYKPIDLYKLKTIKEVPEIDFEASKKDKEDVLDFINKKQEKIEDPEKNKVSKKPTKGTQMKLF